MQGLAREIIFAVGDNMNEGLEPLLTKTLAPSLYQVYLHPDDFDRLRTIFGQIEAEARIHLDRRLKDLEEHGPNQLLQKPKKVLKKSVGRLPKRFRAAASATPATADMRYEPAAGEWHIRFQEDPNGDLAPGEVEVVSELAVGELVEYGAGSPTEKIKISTTRKLGASSSQRHPQAAEATSPATGPVGVRAMPDSEAPTAPVERLPKLRPLPSAAGDAPPARSAAKVLAALDYDDQGEMKSFELKTDREEVLIGRGALDVWVDLRLHTPVDVSRRHALIRRDDRDRFWIQDLSQYGTWVDGRQVPQGDEIELTDGALIDLAAVAKLRFRRERPSALPPLPVPPPPQASP